MSEEKEIKVRILEDISIDEIKRKIAERFGVRFGHCTRDEDVYYDLEGDPYFKLNQGLRIRNDEYLAYKALFFIPRREPNPWFVFEEEHRLPVSKQDLIHLFDFANIKHDLEMPDTINIEGLKTLLKKLGFAAKINIKKTRWTGKGDNIQILVDSVDKLGSFVEIEAEFDGLLDTSRKRLPFRSEEIRHGYTELYMKEVLKKEAPDFKQSFLDDPDWNYIGRQKQAIRQIITP